MSNTYTEGSTLLTIDNVCVAYDKPVLHNLSAEIKDIICTTKNADGSHVIKGQITAILGPSGVGKTQLFRVIAGLQKPDSGMVYINNCACGCAVADHVWMIGRQHDDHGAAIGASIVQSFNLIDENLAWQPDITTRLDFMSFVSKLRKLFWAL